MQIDAEDRGAWPCERTKLGLPHDGHRRLSHMPHVQQCVCRRVSCTCCPTRNTQIYEIGPWSGQWS